MMRVARYCNNRSKLASADQQLFTEIPRNAELTILKNDRDSVRLTGDELETMASGAHSPVETVASC